jgi:hypothetical protein
VNYRNRDLLNLAYYFPCSLNFPGCEGGDTGEPAHSNQPRHGKGGAMKAHDCYHVPACRHCHRELDQGRTMDRDEKHDAWNRAFDDYLPALWIGGYIRPATTREMARYA